MSGFVSAWQSSAQEMHRTYILMCILSSSCCLCFSLFMWVQPESTQKLYVCLWVTFVTSCVLPYKLLGFMIGEWCSKSIFFIVTVRELSHKQMQNLWSHPPSACVGKLRAIGILYIITTFILQSISQTTMHSDFLERCSEQTVGIEAAVI